MVTRRTAVLTVAFLASGASAAQAVEPQAGVALRGKIQFPRAQEMTVQTSRTNGSSMTAYLGFHGTCRGGGLSKLWASNILAKPTIRVRNGRFAATVTGVTRNVGGVEGRTGTFRWRFVGRFVSPNVITATVSGSGDVRQRGATISKCTIASPATVRLTIRA